MSLEQEFQNKFYRLVDYDTIPEFIDAYFKPDFLDDSILEWIKEQIQIAEDFGFQEGYQQAVNDEYL